MKMQHMSRSWLQFKFGQIALTDERLKSPGRQGRDMALKKTTDMSNGPYTYEIAVQQTLVQHVRGYLI